VTKRELPVYESDQINLRLLEEKDLTLTCAWRNQDAIRKWFLDSNIISEDQHKAWFSQYQERDDDFVFIIEQKGENFLPIGQISLYKIDWISQRAVFGRLMIGEISVRGKGIAKIATNLVLKIAFRDLDIKEVTLEVRSDNLPALAVYRDCGFIKTGVIYYGYSVR
jgi:RimJ/RimL family protein N-acetyltransferase